MCRLQDLTWACREEMAACPEYLRRRLQQAAAMLGSGGSGRQHPA